MRTQVLSILMSVAALGLIGCGKGFESVNKANKALGPEKTMPWPNADDSAAGGVPITNDKFDASKLEQVLRAIDLKAGATHDQVQVRAIIQTDADTILDLSSDFKELVDREKQTSKLETVVGRNLVNLVEYNSSLDSARFEVECDKNCEVVVVTVLTKTTAPAPFQFVLTTDGTEAIYMISKNGELSNPNFEAKLLEINAEITGSQVSAIVEEEAAVEATDDADESPMSDYEQSVQDGTVDDTDWLKPGAVENTEAEEVMELSTMEVHGTAEATATATATADERSVLDKAKEFGGDLKRSHADLAGKIVDGHEVAVDATSEYVMPVVAPAVDWTNKNKSVLWLRGKTTDVMEWTANKWNSWTSDKD